MVTAAIGRNRSDAVYRAGFVLVLLIASASAPSITGAIIGLVLTLAFVAGLLWFLVDVVLQALFNDEGLMQGGSGVTMWLERLFFWPWNIVLWVVFGQGSFPWTP